MLRRAATCRPRSQTRLWPSARTLSTANPGNVDDEAINVAVIGTGRMGAIRLAGMQQHPKFRIAAIVDGALTGSRVAHYARQYGAKCFESIEAAGPILADTVQAVWISTPTPTHMDLIQRLLQFSSHHGKGKLRAIGIEKPVAGTLEEIDAIYNLCLDASVPLFCSFQRRFDPSYQALRRQCVDENRLGAIQSIHTVFRDHPCPPLEFLRTGGDPFHDLAVHDIDYVCNLVGEYPSRVYAYGTSHHEELRSLQVMDKASVWLEFPRSGVVCTMDLSRRADYGYDQRIEVSGERGMLQVLNPPRTHVLRADGEGFHEDALVHSFPERFREAYELELAHFMDVIEGRTMPIVHWNAARMATIVAEAARIAAIERKMVTIKYKGTKQSQPRQDPYLVVDYEY